MVFHILGFDVLSFVYAAPYIILNPYLKNTKFRFVAFINFKEKFASFVSENNTRLSFSERNLKIVSTHIAK